MHISFMNITHINILYISTTTGSTHCCGLYTGSCINQRFPLLCAQKLPPFFAKNTHFCFYFWRFAKPFWNCRAKTAQTLRARGGRYKDALLLPVWIYALLFAAHCAAMIFWFARCLLAADAGFTYCCSGCCQNDFAGGENFLPAGCSAGGSNRAHELRRNFLRDIALLILR